jgi:phosphorylase kinase alpha/beta subunit
MNVIDTTIIHHDEIQRRIKARYSSDDVRGITAFLMEHGVLNFTPLPTGLFPAAGIDPLIAVQSGYGNVWVRDNVYVALAHAMAGRWDVAVAAIEALAAFYKKYRNRFEDIIDGRADFSLPMNRPQVRFDGINLAEIATGWSHAQNDALGYFLWIYCRAAHNGRLAPDPSLLTLFALYFKVIRYWEDEDSGHWEERRKIEASSIGAVVAGLEALRELVATSKIQLGSFRNLTMTTDDLDRLIISGNKALASILPAECTQPDTKKYRRYDSALLFLVYPLAVVDDDMGQQIVNDVTEHLQGGYGIRRYLGDSYWTADYKDKLPREALTADVSEHQEDRDALARLGEEAQWCIFDPIISVISGQRYMRTKDPVDLERQIKYLNRSLGQITGKDCKQGELLCPEAYYLEHGHFAPNDHVPLLWTQANLWLAIMAMEHSVTH